MKTHKPPWSTHSWKETSEELRGIDEVSNHFKDEFNNLGVKQTPRYQQSPPKTQSSAADHVSHDELSSSHCAEYRGRTSLGTHIHDGD